MLPPLQLDRRVRPVALISTPAHVRRWAAGTAPVEETYPSRPVAPSTTVLAHLSGDPAPGQLGIGWRTDRISLAGWYDATTGRTRLTVDAGTGATSHRSRRHGTVSAPATALALTLTGPQLTLFTQAPDGAWTARARADLTGLIDCHDPRLLADLTPWHHWRGAGPPPVTGLECGPFGQLGFRDPRFVSHADGTPYRTDDGLWLTLTHAGPGFFPTAHTGVWSLDPDTGRLQHRADLFFRRDGGIFGDHATHLVRDDDQWLVAASTWGDFDPDRPGARVEVTLSRTDADLLTGTHLLDGVPLRLPTEALARSVGVWDPHLVRTDAGWLVAFVSATRFFSFHPALAAGPTLDALELLAADESRTATEGVTLLQVDGSWRLVASDGPRSPRGTGGRYPVFDLTLTEVGTLTAPYPSNIPWPTLARHRDGWCWVTFDGTEHGGALLGYGSHGDLLLGSSE
ncbi:hypothetical protein [Nocardioides limicola]|uniref:hypothetical protein n=1 Tax=Nocardioides limicola TaxID=2803368 RepID=UPI00193B756E|nr:hypothetical protein [Nocardioides sp. DJM-14]